MRNFYKFILLVIITFTGLGQVRSQEFLSGLSDNYMGINQAILQPAAILDSRFVTDINVAGIQSDFNNNAIRFKSKYIMDPYSIIQKNDWWKEYTHIDQASHKPKDIYMLESALGPSFLLNITPKHAIGFTSRVRSITNADDISDQLFRTIYSSFTDEAYWNLWFKDEKIRAVEHAFADYDLIYATEILNNGAHYLKGGVTAKLLQGINAAYMQADSVFLYFDGSDGGPAYPVSINSPVIYAGISDNWGDYKNGIYDFSVNYQYTSRPSAGFDVGFVYEYRPKYKNFRYDMDGVKDIERRDQNKYLLKIGASVTDIGRLKYKKDYESFDFVADFTVNYYSKYLHDLNNVPDSTYWLESDSVSFSFEEYVNFIDTIATRYSKDLGVKMSGSDNPDFIVKLPTALSLQVDVNIIKGLYVNLTTYTCLNQGFKNIANSHYISNYSITPRYEHKWFTVSVPFSYDQYQKLNVGLGVRAAFVYFGVNNLLSGLIQDPYGLNAYVGVKIPIWQKGPPSDLDGDKVSDAKDKCPDTPGLPELDGCPDRDGDGVTDAEDNCPDIAGLKYFNGCPDSDGDGVMDMEDDCPDVYGSKLTKGCPDKDGDGVIDSRDECPDVAGPERLNGCPDKDGDGVPDIKDQCPDEPGPADQGGCPFKDTDLDGVKDSEDRCPTQAGPPENFGCPYTDTDADGVIDKDDRCPLTPGDPTNFGCPVIKQDEAAVLKTAFENLEFETGKNVIKSTSFPSLNELATLLISKPAWKLKISGHTDNVGNDASNMTLSKNRAQATAAYLQGRGVPASQIITEWFGETMPIADNSTAEGRQKNRRVEMQIVFD